jgi:hypothetical protein
LEAFRPNRGYTPITEWRGIGLNKQKPRVLSNFAEIIHWGVYVLLSVTGSQAPRNQLTKKKKLS